MTRWFCEVCGWEDHTGIYPDCCMRPMTPCIEITAEPRVNGFCEGSTFYRDRAEIEPWAAQAIAAFDAEMKAGDVASTIRLWQSGCELSPEQQAIIDQVLTVNRVDQITRIHDKAA